MRMATRVGAALAGGAVALGAWAAPAGAEDGSDEQRLDYAFTARDGEEVTCSVAAFLDVGRSGEPRSVDILGATEVTGPDMCAASLLEVSVHITYVRSGQEEPDTLGSFSTTGTEAHVSAHLQGDVTGTVRGDHSATFRCLIGGSAQICTAQVRTSAK
jgi:hypothetical protein